MLNNRVKMMSVLLVVFVFVAALALFFALNPENAQMLFDGGGDLMGKCLGSGSGSCDIGV
jgi:hypothetical protein